MSVVFAAAIVAVAVVVLMLTRPDTRRFVRACTTRTSWERSLHVADESADLRPSDEVRLFVTTSGRYAPGYTALIPLEEPTDHVVVAIADSDSRAGFPVDMEPEGLPEGDVAGYVSTWGLRGITDATYRDAILLRHFRNVLSGDS
ncbi:hypothetical protein [Curtobacterium sp. TXMA1]|uniref:hypothetical protein n=1 Tax=Curtobacterium sp. TXMA1 TaxID=2876939 RepID=UPI001CCAE850|nr:hypothetical protein [Curtobacterium sp. TXMA1]UBQ03100.1 hypothetical protein LCG91_02720 [Curtobacterium sp. TXMA1]